MPVFSLARHPSRAIRIAFMALLLAFGLNAFAHASHHHQSETASDIGVNSTAPHAAACGYCATFNALADTTQTPAIGTMAQPLTVFATVFFTATIVRRTATSANPRAPPRSLPPR